MTAKDLEQKINAEEDVYIIDVREKDEVLKGKIPEAKHIPLGEITKRLSGFDKSKHNYVICTKGARGVDAL
ncbi:rhodanese-like domain-containing protein [Pseudogracilibacillus sp. SO30301A]|uniref:rhodanese-like domain-containing protein n=1 Tax=Pseudogracilibacillus sp. SO30301A TaxID=3098291 RepID=UPI00300E4D71